MMIERLEYLYKKNIDKTCTEEEYLEFCELVADEKNNTELERLADASWEDETASYIIPDDRAKIIFNDMMLKGQTADKKRRQKAIGWYKWAAIFLIMASACFILLRLNKNPQNIVSMVEAKAVNEHQLIKLPDGSTVVLNANSFLKYPKNFVTPTREVTLTGEGYFDIKHNPEHPFIVHTGKLMVTVLGTAFNIKAYNKENNITVTVTRGKVSVSDEKTVLGVILPNQQISFNKTNENVVQSLVNSSKTIEWQSKDLFLDDMTMQQAAVTLGQHFNVKITFDGEAVKNCRFTGTFLHGEKLTDILRVICAFNNAAYKTADDGHIVISGPGCS